MGFNKRFINIDNVIKIYESSDIQGVERYIKTPDALFIRTKKEQKILDIIINDSCDTIKKIKLEEILYGNKST